MKKARGLGRGLDALLGDDSSSSAVQSDLQNVSVKNLQSGKYQPRTKMDEASLNALADSIKAQGLMQPILVRDIGGQQLEIIAGERRWRAAQIAGLTEVPVIIKSVPDEAALAMALIENIQREDLNPLEEAAGIQRLIDEFGMTHQIAAEAVGRSRSAVTNLLRLLNLQPEIQVLMMDAKIDMGHARCILSAPNALQLEIVDEVISKQLSVRETEKLVSRKINPAAKKEVIQDRDVINLEEGLSDRLGAKVVIQTRKNGSGRLTIEYSSYDQLDNIINKL
ncbi:chromosome partitioning protein ParB [Sulfuriferula sp. AH1]|uniref:ParB/RepB/Spo0J family partition protein n=1 Tax=Sulfuriferula sp. AH1 TaxID=1985873 RepID=UPI000B3B6372|nr:ParB/RepB/Spo0J family partition protein [Sulfuriferula sp. AH1]ARU32759.1 chromosome partitioning protein ParB [Sulfuriferula sp. AH1]